MILIRNSLAALLLLLVGTSSNAQDSTRTPGTFDKAVQPFLKMYCLHCHGSTKQEGEFRLDVSDPNFRDQDVAETWGEVLERINAGEMPPKGEPQPDAAATGRVVSWISARIKEGEAARMAARGPVTHYRLSREEYANTVYDLLGIRYNVHAIGAFDEDPRWRGYERIGSMLSLAPAHVESYLKAADAVISEAYLSQPVKSTLVRKDASEGREQWLIENKIDGRVRWLMYPGRRFDIPVKTPGTYRVRVQLSGLQPPGGRAPHLTIGGVGYDEDVLIAENKPTVVEATGYVDGSISIMNDVPVPKRAKHNKFTFSQSTFINTRDMRFMLPWDFKLIDDDGQAIFPVLIVDWYEVEGPLTVGDEVARRTRFEPVELAEPAAIRNLLHRFAEQAWRRPPTDEEIDRYVRIVAKGVVNGEKPRQAQITAMIGILTSKNFYYLKEGEPKARRDQINDWELASRLSYFLWSTMPDEKLLTAARTGTLRDNATLRRELARMIADPKIDRFTQTFPKQWLQLHRLGEFPPDKKLYPDYDGWLERSMIRETTGYFAEVFRQNLSIRDFLSSDWTVLNARMGMHYALPQPPGIGMQRVKLKADSHRGGLLTQASILALTSDGTRHRPVHRGVWVSEAIFGTTPPSPPPNVEPLEPTPSNLPKATIRQQLEAHTTHTVCSSCHRHIDPLGFAFDNFDAIGRWRTTEKMRNGKGDDPLVNAAGLLPDGRTFDGPDEFKQRLVKDLDRFAEAFVENLATYALRRVMTVDDAEQIRTIARASKSDAYRLRTILENLITSDLFLKR